MQAVFKQFKWIMLVSGVLTCTMAYAAIAPEAALRSTFGEALSGPVAEIVVRSWGVLITLIGMMLIYGAFNAGARRLILAVAGASKLAFVALVLAIGDRALVQHAMVPLVIDGLWVALFAWYLLAARSS